MVRRIPISKWPLGLEHDLAFVRVSAKTLARRGKVKLSRSRDGLDDFVGAVIRVDHNRFAGIIEYANSPVPGSKIVVTDFGKRTVFGVLRLLGIKRSELAWVHPEAVAVVESAFRRSKDLLPVRTAIRRRSIATAQRRIINHCDAEWRLAA